MREAQKLGSPLPEVTSDPLEAVAGADVVYTDVWTSMGQEAEAKKRLAAFQGFQVTPEMMAVAAPEAVFMHCLPAHRGEEVAADVIDGPQSVVFDEAENRLHVQKAILVTLMGEEKNRPIRRIAVTRGAWGMESPHLKDARYRRSRTWQLSPECRTTKSVAWLLLPDCRRTTKPSPPAPPSPAAPA